MAQKKRERRFLDKRESEFHARVERFDPKTGQIVVVDADTHWYQLKRKVRWPSVVSCKHEDLWDLNTQSWGNRPSACVYKCKGSPVYEVVVFNWDGGQDDYIRREGQAKDLDEAFKMAEIYASMAKQGR